MYVPAIALTHGRHLLRGYDVSPYVNNHYLRNDARAPACRMLPRPHAAWAPSYAVIVADTGLFTPTILLHNWGESVHARNA